MKHKRLSFFGYLFLIVLISVMTGCTSINIRNADDVPMDRIYINNIDKVNGYSKVVFLRENAFIGRAFLVTLFINDSPVAKLDTGEKLVLYLEPGNYTYNAQQTQLGFIKPDNSMHYQLRDSLNPNRTYYYKLSVQMQPEGVRIDKYFDIE